MFGFGKTKGHDEDFDYDSVVSKYEGEVAVGDYVAESLNRSEVNKLGKPYHLMVPHGHGKILICCTASLLKNTRACLMRACIMARAGCSGVGKYLKVNLMRDSSLVELNPRLLTPLCLWVLVLPWGYVK